MLKKLALSFSLFFFTTINLFASLGTTSYIPVPNNENEQIEIYLQSPAKSSNKLIVTSTGASAIGININEYYKSFFQYYVDKGYHIAQVSLPGYGNTSGVKDLCGPNTVSTLNIAIDHLVKKLNIEKLGIVASGQGGWASLLVASQRDDIQCLICANGLNNLQEHQERNSDFITFIKNKNIYQIDFSNPQAVFDRTPLNFVSSINCPTYVIHKNTHPYVNTSEIIEFEAAMHKLNKECEVLILEGSQVNEQKITYGEYSDLVQDWFDGHMS